MSPEAQAVANAIASGRYDAVTLSAARLLRVTRHEDGEPYWSVGKRNRFDCPGTGTQYGVNYCAPALSTAFAESVLHEDRHFDRSQSRWVISDGDVLSARWIVELQRSQRPDLVLFPLFGDALTRLNIGNSISSGDDYAVTQEVSQVIHDNAPELDGIAYVSNRANQSIAMAVFQRSGARYGNLPVRTSR